MLDWLIYQVPWWVWAGFALLLYAVGLYVAAAIFGWQRVRPFALPAIALLGAFAMLHRSRQSGWEAKVKKDLAAADKLIDRAARTRAKAEADARQPGKLREKDEFMRDD